MSSFRVLQIDDEPDILEIVAASLSLDPEFEVRGCGSGADGITAAAQWRPDLILLDVMMPVMDGTRDAQAFAGEPTDRRYSGGFRDRPRANA